MGGNLFPTNKRVESREKFFDLFEKQKELLKSITEEMYLPSQIDSKETFGDQDIILPYKHLDAVAELLEATDYPLEIKRNSVTGVIEYNVISYQYDSHQIDLIFIEDECIEYAVNYFSYGDHGNIIGRLLKKFSLKNSFNGFYFIYRRDDGNYKRNVLVSYDYYFMLNLLELDVDKFKEGFQTQEEVFDWLISTPYFDSTIYSFEQMNNKDRTRDKKRKFYNDFLKYLEINEIDFKSNKTIKLSLDSFKERYIECDNTYESIQKYRNKFNGFLVSNLKNIEGIELGLYMKAFKESYTQEDILKLSDEELENLILNFKY